MGNNSRMVHMLVWIGNADVLVWQWTAGPFKLHFTTSRHANDVLVLSPFETGTTNSEFSGPVSAPPTPPPHTHTKCLCFPPCLPITTHNCQKYLWWCAVKPNKNWRTLRKSQEDEGHHELKFYFVVLLTVFWLFCRGTSGFIGRQTQFRPISNITWSLDARESVLGHSGGSLSGHPDRRQESDVLLRNHYSIHRCLPYRI